MKKIILVLCILISLCGCDSLVNQEANVDQRYLSIIEMLNDNDNFLTTSNYFDAKLEVAAIDEGYRYYVTIENPKIAMYDFEALAIEKDVDYVNNMAANIGIFDINDYNMIPNQKNPDKGYYTGAILSGTCDHPDVTLYMFVSFKNKDYSVNHTEYLTLTGTYDE